MTTRWEAVDHETTCLIAAREGADFEMCRVIYDRLMPRVPDGITVIESDLLFSLNIAAVKHFVMGPRNKFTN